MSDEKEDAKTNLTVGLEEVTVTVTGEPTVVFTMRGYAPVVPVKTGQGESKRLFISAASMANAIEPMKLKNGGKFTGLKFALKKESTDKFAKYVVREL